MINAKSLKTEKTDSCEWSLLGPIRHHYELKLTPINIYSTPVATIEDLIDIKKCECHQPLNVAATSLVSLVSPIDILRRINDDRLRSTYQTDFGHIDDYPWSDYNDFIILSNKTCRIVKKPYNVMKCRERPKLPYLYGHEIPGSHHKATDLFDSFGNKNRKKKRRNVGPEGTNLPSRSARLRLTLQQSKNISNKTDVIKKNSINYQRDQNEIMRNPVEDERRETGNESLNEREKILGSMTSNTRNISDEKLKNLLGNVVKHVQDNNDVISKQSLGGFNDNISNISDKKLQEKMRSITGGVRYTKTDEKTINKDQKSVIINKKISDPKRSLLAKKDTKMVDKINKEAKNIHIDNVFSSGKPRKDNIDELKLISSMPWTSEYQDIISRTADDIMKSKLHYYGKLRLTTPNPDCP